MRITIVSDSHDNLVNIDKMLTFCKKEKIEVMLHCGDICSPSALDYLARNFSGKIFYVLGNVHGELEEMEGVNKKRNNLVFLGDQGDPVIKGVNLKIGMVHYPDVAKKMAETKKYDFVFHGHTHQPWEETIGHCKVVNPGTLAGMFNKPTFAVLNTETKNLELKLLELL